MDKMTHTKFNLNSFLMALSTPFDKLENKNRFNVKYNSNRVSYIALRLSTMCNFKPALLSDIFSYSKIYKNDFLKKHLNLFPFQDISILKNKIVNEILYISTLIENNINISNNIIINNNKIVDIVLNNSNISEDLKDKLRYIFEEFAFWFDLTSECQLSYNTLNFLDDFTIELGYDKLLTLTTTINDMINYHTGIEDIKDEENKISKRCERLCAFYNFDKKDSSRMIISSNLIHIGMLYLSKDIFLKKDKLNDEELFIIKTVPYNSSVVISQIFGFDDITQLCSLYCEKLDGSGYPYGVTANNLSFKNRIIIILSIYQALTNNRSYRGKYTHSEAIDILKDEAKAGRLDISIIENFDTLF